MKRNASFNYTLYQNMNNQKYENMDGEYINYKKLHDTYWLSILLLVIINYKFDVTLVLELNFFIDWNTKSMNNILIIW